MASGANLQPVFSEYLQQPSSSLAVLTGSDQWKTERAIVVAMLPIIPFSFVLNQKYDMI